MKKGCLFIAMGLGLLFFLAFFYTVFTFDSSKIVSKAPEEIINYDSIRFVDSLKKRNEKIDAQFSVWDGAHTNLEKSIKLSLSDPESYEHIKTERQLRGDSLEVLTTFRSRNGFGGMITNQARAFYTIDGDQISAEFLN